jgi:uncharacterized protein (AIM24 family)
MHDQLLGAMQPILSITLQPGETVIAGPGEFSWMSDSIQMSPASAGTDGGRLTAAGEPSLRLAAYTATEAAGTIAFASRLPGEILGIDVGPDREYLVHRHGFLAATPGIRVTTGYRPPFDAAVGAGEFVLRRIGGHGRAWVELSGNVERRQLAPGTSLRTHPWHIGLFEASVALQVATLPDAEADLLGNQVSRFAVVSGPGAVWLQSMSPLAAAQVRLAPSPNSPQVIDRKRG